MSRRPIFRKAERLEFAKAVAEHLTATFGVKAHLQCRGETGASERSVVAVDNGRVETAHGPMFIGFDVSPTMAHLFRRFEARPSSPLPHGPAFNPHSFKWNWWTCPDHGPTVAAVIEAFMADLAAQHDAIRPAGAP